MRQRMASSNCKIFDQTNWKNGVATFSEGEAVGGAGLGGVTAGLGVGSGDVEQAAGCGGPEVHHRGLGWNIWDSSASKCVSGTVPDPE